MSKIAKALYEHDETFAEIADVLFGDGADELIAKMNPDSADVSLAQKKNQKRQAQVGLATNVIGITAGGAGLAAANRDYKNEKMKAAGIKPISVKHRGQGKLLRKLPAGMKNPKNIAAGALGLQAANLGGDLIANRVLSREAKKKVHKSAKSTLTPIKKNLKRELAEVGYDTASTALDPRLKPLKKKVKAKVKYDTLGEVAKNIEEDVDITFTGEISKLDSDKKQVFGWASVTEVDGKPVLDRQGDYIALEEIEKSAYHYVHNSRKGGDMHQRDETADVALHKSDMIESFVVTPEKLEKMGLEPDALPHGWWVGYAVNDDNLWNLVKSGKRVGFSIHGKGVRTPMGEMQ